MTEHALFLLPALRRARDLIDRDYAEPLDLVVLAAEAGYSRFHFARAFRAAYGETPRTYLTRRRIERAKTLLRTANLPVTEICFLVGFASLGSFSARFRKLVRRSPSEDRDDAVARNSVPPIPGCVVLMWTRAHPETINRLTVPQLAMGVRSQSATRNGPVRGPTQDAHRLAATVPSCGTQTHGVMKRAFSENHL